MKNIALTFTALLSFFFAPQLMPAAFAQLAQLEPASESTVKTEDLQKLIDTLQSDTDRKSLVSNLQILLDQQNKESKKTEKESLVPDITEQFGVKGQIANMVKLYQDFLNKNAISSSLVHQSLGSLVVLIFGVGLFLGVRKIAFKLILAIDHFSEKIGLKLTRISFYTRVFQNLLKVLIISVVAYTLGKIWSLQGVVGIFESDHMRSFLVSAVTVFIVAIVAALIWEAVGIYLSYILKQATDKDQTRIKTLLPIIRNIVLSVFALLFGLVIMSEMGLNVAPFLAGAGVLGVAIGFGAQSMVKDFLTGFTIVLEDIIRVGDVATLGGSTGVVEKITLRKVQLRDMAGIVYTIPFSQITTIQNLTKDFSFYAMDISVSYNENTDKVVDVLKQVGDEMLSDIKYAPFMLAPLEVIGVDAFADSAVIIKARLKTRPIKQWEVGREFNRRMKIAFDKNGIEIPFPQRVVTMRMETPEAS